jgi:tetratricopeptide (TPR) repeat protein
MEKSLILFLNLLLIAQFSCCQTVQSSLPKCDCFSKTVQDSLIERYLENGAEHHDYNGPVWGQYCDSLIAICPNIAFAYQHKAIPYIKYGDYAKAFPLENKAVELDPKRWTAYRGFLKCMFTKDYEGAIIDFQKAQQLTPNSYEMDHTYAFYEGLCNLELGRYSKAIENLEHDILIQTNGKKGMDTTAHFNTLMYMGIVYYEMNNTIKAKEYLVKCLASFKELPDANYYLALVYKRENKNKLATKYLKIAKEAKSIGYSLNEDNLYYTNYPHQITMNEIDKELSNL